MTPEDYMTQRVDDQVSWYERKSMSAQKWFKRLRWIEIVCAAAIPVLAAYSDTEPARVTLALLGALVVVLASLLSLGRYQENWIEYRTTCESLRHEKYCYLTEVEPYNSSEEDSFALFVQRIENLISKENSQWAQLARNTAKPLEKRSVG
jgi:Protein of unknown function (DUF4231)